MTDDVVVLSLYFLIGVVIAAWHRRGSVDRR
jgi:hypothetical protein